MTFSPFDALGSTVNCIAVQADGMILLGGSFKSICGQARSYLARLKADGNLDSSLNASPDSSVNALVAQPDGNLLVGGAFTNINGQSRTFLGRIGGDGTLDASFNPTLDGGVRSIALQTNGSVVLGGDFATVNGAPCGQLCRLKTDGTLDTGFLGTVGGRVCAVAVQADGKVLAGGLFTNLDGLTQAHLGRLNADGSLDSGFNPACNGTVYSLALQADGKIIVGGFFTAIGGQSLTNLARLNTDGTADPSFTAASGLTFALTLQQGGKLIVAGLFSKLAGQSRTNIGRLTNPDVPSESLASDATTIHWLRGGASPEISQASFEVSTNAGANWQSLGAGSRVPGGWQITGLALPANANVRALGTVVGGNGNASSWPVELTAGPPLITMQPSSLVVSTGATAIFSVGAEGSPALSYQWRKDGANLAGATGSSLMLSNTGPSVIGSYDVVVTNSLGAVVSSSGVLVLAARATADSFAPHLPQVLTGQALAVADDGKVLAVITTSGLPDYSYLARFNPDGSTDAGFGSTNLSFSFQPNNLISSIAIQEDGSILVGGYFTTFNGQSRATLCRLSPQGVLDSSFNPSTDGQVDCLALQADGRILVGGFFKTVNGQAQTNLVRFNSDGTLDASFTPVVNGTVSFLALQSDGSILAAGSFSSVNGQSRTGLARLFADGSLDATFNPVVAGRINALAIQADGRIILGGNIAALAGQARNNIGRLNPDGTLDTTFNPGSDVMINTFALQADGKLLVGGSFFSLAGRISELGRLNPDGSVDSTFSPGVAGPVQCIIVQPDGKALVGGGFRSLGGQPRSYIGRLNATDPARQSLALSGAGLAWMRGGTSPETWRVSFDATTNGLNWLNLGSGTRISGGWVLAAPALAPGATVRARGFVLNQGTAGWFLETWLFQQPLTILVNEGHFEPGPGGFGFNLAGSPGQQAVIESSTDLINWTALSTNSRGVSPFFFSDPGWTNYPLRFYRAWSP